MSAVRCSKSEKVSQRKRLAACACNGRENVAQCVNTQIQVFQHWWCATRRDGSATVYPVDKRQYFFFNVCFQVSELCLLCFRRYMRSVWNLLRLSCFWKGKTRIGLTLLKLGNGKKSSEENIVIM